MWLTLCYYCTEIIYLNEGAKSHGNSFRSLILILIACGFGIQAHDMENIPNEIIPLAESSQLTYHMCHLSIILPEAQRWKDRAPVHLESRVRQDKHPLNSNSSNSLRVGKLPHDIKKGKKTTTKINPKSLI